MTEKIALIARTTGQDGAHRCTTSTNFRHLAEPGLDSRSALDLVEFDLTDQDREMCPVQRCKADEIYNLAARSFGGVSFDQHIGCQK